MRSVWLAVLAACGNSGARAADAPIAIDAAFDAAIDAPLPPDPWTAALGDPIAGLTLSDGWTDVRAMLPPMAITGGWTDSLFALPAGNELRFAYEQEDFFDFYISGGTTDAQTGPVLAGVTSDYFKMFDATLTDAGWTIAPDPVNSPDPTLVEASPATNASDDLYVFTRFDPQSGHALLYYSELVAGSWSAATELPFNAPSCNTDNAKIVGELATGVSIYFESNRGDDAGASTTCGNRTLYFTTYSNGSFTPVAPVPGIAEATSDDSQPWISADLDTLYFTSVRDGEYGVFTATRASPDDAFANIHPVVQPTTVPADYAGNDAFIGEASIVDRPQGSLLYMMCGVASDTHGGDTFGDADDVTLVPCVARRAR